MRSCTMRILISTCPRTRMRRWVQGDAMALPFGSGEFDAATMGYGLRNVTDRPAALRELHRVLKPGGWVGGWGALACLLACVRRALPACVCVEGGCGREDGEGLRHTLKPGGWLAGCCT